MTGKTMGYYRVGEQLGRDVRIAPGGKVFS